MKKNEDLLKKLTNGATHVTRSDQLNAGYRFIEENGLTDHVDDLLGVLDWLNTPDDLALLLSGTQAARPQEPSFSPADRYKLDRVYRHLENLEESSDGVARTPIWRPDAGKHGVLYLGELVVKNFDRLAANQILLIEAFDKANWKFRIENPFLEATSNNVNAASDALRNTVESLNKSVDLMEFGTLNTKTEVIWNLKG